MSEGSSFQQIVATGSLAEIGDIIGRADFSLQDLDLEALFRNERSVRELLDQTGERLDTFRNVVRFLHHIPPGRHTRLLLDVDVLRTHLENTIRPAASDIFVHHVFLGSEVEYGLAIGAFHELMRYIFRLLGHQNPPAVDPQNARAQVAEVLGIATEDIDDPSTGAKLAKDLNLQRFKVGRLLDILRSPRYGDVFCEHDPELVRELTHKIAKHRTPKEEFVEHSAFAQRDRYDALNLAVAIHNYKHANQANEHFIVLTRTNAVIAASKAFLDHTDGCWIAATPEQVFIASLLSFGRERDMALTKAKMFRKQLERLERSIDDELDYSGSSAYAEILKFGRDDMKNVLLELQESAKNLVSGDWVGIEGALSTVHSIQAISGRQEDDDSEKKEFADYLRMLDSLCSLLGESKGFEYEYDLRDPGHDKYREYWVFPKTQEGDEYARLIIRVAKDPDEKQPLWQYQFRTAVAVKRIMQCFDNTEGASFLDAVGPRSVDRLEVPVAQDSELWRHGLVLSASDFTVGVPFAVLVPYGSWLGVNIESLAELGVLRTALGADVRARPAVATHGKGGRSRVSEIRLNLDWGNVAVDVLPDADSAERFVTVLSDCHIPKTVTHLFGFLGMRLAAPKRLEERLNEIGESEQA